MSIEASVIHAVYQGGNYCSFSICFGRFVCNYLFSFVSPIFFIYLFVLLIPTKIYKKRVASKIDRLQTSFSLLFLNSTYDDNYAWLTRCEFPPLFFFLFPLLPIKYFSFHFFLASFELNGCSWTLNRHDKKIQYWMKYSKLKINEIKFSWDFV